MGIGWRLEHCCRGEGALTLDGETRTFRLVGSRIKRQSVRPLNAFRGHCWQSALFPDGRAFGFITYPPGEDGSEPYNEGYVFQDGKLYPARATRIPFMSELLEEGDDVALELQSELGTTRIEGVTTLSTYMIMDLASGTFNLHQGGARYTWDGLTVHGMIERSSTGAQMAARRGLAPDAS
jgi:hypothetical protein